jgi:hypothetical protein
MTLRERVLEAICSVRVPPMPGSDEFLYAGEDGKMPLYDPDDYEAGLLADAVVEALGTHRTEYAIQYRGKHVPRIVGGAAFVVEDPDYSVHREILADEVLADFQPVKVQRAVFEGPWEDAH